MIQISVYLEGLSGIFMCNYFEFGPSILEEMLFEDFSIFSSGGHFVRRAEPIVQFWWRAF